MLPISHRLPFFPPKWRKGFRATLRAPVLWIPRAPPSWPLTMLRAGTACAPSSQTNTAEFYLPMIVFAGVESLAAARSCLCSRPMLGSRHSEDGPVFPQELRGSPRTIEAYARGSAASSLRNMWPTENSNQQSKKLFSHSEVDYLQVHSTNCRLFLLFALNELRLNEKSPKRFGASLPFLDIHSFHSAPPSDWTPLRSVRP